MIYKIFVFEVYVIKLILVSVKEHNNYCSRLTYFSLYCNEILSNEYFLLQVSSSFEIFLSKGKRRVSS